MFHTYEVVDSIPIPPTSVDEGFRVFLKPFLLWCKHGVNN